MAVVELSFYYFIWDCIFCQTSPFQTLAWFIEFKHLGKTPVCSICEQRVTNFLLFFTGHQDVSHCYSFICHLLGTNPHWQCAQIFLSGGKTQLWSCEAFETGINNNKSVHFYWNDQSFYESLFVAYMNLLTFVNEIFQENTGLAFVPKNWKNDKKKWVEKVISSFIHFHVNSIKCRIQWNIASKSETSSKQYCRLSHWCLTSTVV